MTDGQNDSLAFMRSFLVRDESNVARIDTHLPALLLGGDLALKLKRSVKLPFVDFTDVAHRLAICEHELALNRRIAPSMYQAVRRLTRRPDRTLEVDDGGPLVDSYVEIRRFQYDDRFDAMARVGRLTPELMDRLARPISA